MPWQKSDPIRIEIPGPPKALERNRHRIVTPRGKPAFVTSYMPTQSAREQSTIRGEASLVMRGRPPLDGPIELKFVAYLSIPQSWSRKKQAAALADQIRPGIKPDLSNLVKQCEDAMNGICYRDDSLITDCLMWKRYSEKPRIVIEIRSLTWVPHHTDTCPAMP